MTVLFAMLLDAALGEPDWLWKRLPHPAVLMGRLIAQLEKRFNTGNRRQNGILCVILLVITGWVFGRILMALPGIWAEVIIGAILLAQRSLVAHVQDVADSLNMSLDAGRQAVAKIVSRDTTHMDDSAVARSAIESAAENLSDGVIAPVFWFALLGLPGLIVYKLINTADSMIGYKTDRYREFGWAAARFDDVLNWIPARMTALLIWLTDRQSNWRNIQADAKLHRSPNAGWPEAAMAYKHNLALAGPRSYDGKLTDFPFVNAGGKQFLKPVDITAAIQTLWQVWGLGLLFALFAAIF